MSFPWKMRWSCQLKIFSLIIESYTPMIIIFELELAPRNLSHFMFQWYSFLSFIYFIDELLILSSCCRPSDLMFPMEWIMKMISFRFVSISKYYVSWLDIKYKTVIFSILHRKIDYFIVFSTCCSLCHRYLVHTVLYTS